jgi:hypothetical protein
MVVFPLPLGPEMTTNCMSEKSPESLTPVLVPHLKTTAERNAWAHRRTYVAPLASALFA